MGASKVTNRPPLRETAWIDGVRGLVAPYSMIMHFILAFVEIWSGAQGLLTLFFVLGGYVSSRKPLRLMETTDEKSQANLLQTLSASAFRRGFRIYLPSFVAILLTTMLSYLGLFDSIRPLVGKDVKSLYFPGFMPPTPVKRFERLDEQLTYCFKDIFGMLNIWPDRTYQPRHNYFLWSMREEFRCSLYLYITLLASARLRPLLRLSALIILSQFHLACERWEVTLYLLGAAVAQAEISFSTIKWANLDYWIRKTGFSMNNLVLRFVSWLIVAYVCIVLACYPPPYGGKTDPLEFANNHAIIWYLDRITPSYYPHKDKIYNGLSCIVLIVAMRFTTSESVVQALFTNRMAQYLGRNFFGIILIQSIVLHAGGFLVPHMVWSVLDSAAENDHGTWLSMYLNSETRLMLGIVIGLLVNLPITIVLGDIFTRTIIRYCMVAIFWAEKMCCMPHSAEETVAKKTN